MTTVIPTLARARAPLMLACRVLACLALAHPGAMAQPVAAEAAASAATNPTAATPTAATPTAATPAPSTWPDPVVSIDQMEALNGFQLQVRGIVAKGAVTGPTVVRVLVDAQGRVQRAVLHKSCGNGDLDEAVLHGMRDMVFKPYQVAGSAVPVTVLAPVHVPKRLGRS